MKFANVLKNSFFYTLASALQSLMSFFLLPIYTRHLTPQDYAILALVTSFVGILSSIMTLQIHTAIPRFVIKFLKDKERAVRYFSTIFISLLAILFSGCLLINVFGERIISIMFANKDGITYSPFFQIATWTLLPTLLISSGLFLLQTLERGHKFFLVTFIQTGINVSFGLFFVVFLKVGAIGVLWAQFISAVCGLTFIIYLIHDWLRIMLPKLSQDIKDSLRYSIPLIPHMLSIYIYMYSDRLVLQRYLPLSAVGIYSIADTFAYILLIIVNATTAAYSPRFLKVAQEDTLKVQEETRRFIEIWWAGIMVIFMGYLLLSGYIVKLMTQPSFYASIPLIPILAGAYVFRGLYCFSANSIFFVEKTKLIPVITISAALANVGLNLIFIPKFGIFAAAWTTVTSYFITFFLAYTFSKKYFPNIYPWQSMLKTTMLLLSLYIIAKFFNNLISSHNLVNLSINIAFFILFILNMVFILFKDRFRWAVSLFSGL